MMKLLTALCLVHGVAASMLPDWSLALEQQSLAPEESDPSPWPTFDSLMSSVRHSLESLADGMQDGMEDFLSAPFVDDDDDDEDDIDLSSIFDDGPGRPGRPGHHGPHQHNLTVYELIKASKFASNFSSVLDSHKKLVKLLNSTDTNSTVFVPINRAFRGIPHDGDKKKPPAEFVEKLLQYHVADDAYFGRDLLHKHTIPTALKEKLLGGEPQRLRVRVGLFGTNVNFYSKVVVGNVAAKNGVVHFVNHILVPPPFAGRLLSLFPDAFSTLLLAYEKTDFVDKVAHKMNTVGGTVFAPSNSAFRKLGPRANAFLFNSPRGLKILEALLKYQVAPNVTLYSDAVYRRSESDSDETAGIPGDVEHFELDTLLEGKKVFVDVRKWRGIITGMSVNRFVKVSVQDAVAKNAVVHVVERMPIPPHKHRKPGDGDEDDDQEEISPEELEERFAPYLDGEGDVAAGEL